MVKTDNGLTCNNAKRRFVLSSILHLNDRWLQWLLRKHHLFNKFKRNTCYSLLIISQKVKQLNCHVKSVNLPLAFSRSFVKGKEWIDKVNPPSRKPSQVTRWSRPLPVETNNSSRLAATLKITVTNINETALQNLSVKISNKNF